MDRDDRTAGRLHARAAWCLTGEVQDACAFLWSDTLNAWRVLCSAALPRADDDAGSHTSAASGGAVAGADRQAFQNSPHVHKNVVSFRDERRLTRTTARQQPLVRLLRFSQRPAPSTHH